PPVEPEIALAGYCPVSLVQEHKLVPGQTAVTLEHDGRTYQFANAWVRSLFRKFPERFTPVNSGRCPIAQVDRGEWVAGDPRWGVLYRRHLYLCAGRADRSLFVQNPDRYVRVDLADRPLCPHCWSPQGLGPSQSPPRPPVAWSGQRSLFPELRWLQALRSSSS